VFEIKMIDEGKWKASHLDGAEMSPEQRFAAERQAALDNAAIGTAYYLEQIFNEMKRANDYMIDGGHSMKPIPSAKPTTVRKEPTQLKPQPIMPKPTAQPRTADEDSTIEFYKEALEEALDTDQLEKTQVSVEENGIYIKFPYIQDRDTFSSAARILKNLGAEYKSAGKDTHFFIES
jgi:hypothetical protein